ncbi:GGDEF domain-containing protein [Nitratifractor sp.]
MRLSLDRILLYAVLMVLLMGGAFAIYDRYQLRQNLQSEIERELVLESLRMDGVFQSGFERLYRFYNNSTELDRSKLERVRAYFDGNMSRALIPIWKEINQNRLFGNYDIYLIDRDLVIRRSTYEEDVGLDFHDLPFARKIFEMIENGVIPYHVSAPFFQPLSGDFRRYFLTLSEDGSFFIQISHNFTPKPGLYEDLLRMSGDSSGILNFRLYFLSGGTMNVMDEHPPYRSKQGYFRKLKDLKESFVRRYIGDLQLDISAEKLLKDPEALYKLFRSRRLQYRVDESRMRAIVYMGTENLFTKPLNQEMIILRMEYDLSDLIRHYRELEMRHLLLIAGFVLFLLFMIYLLKRLFVDQIKRIVEAIRRDEPIEPGRPEIEEFRRLAESIEGYREKLARHNRELEKLTILDPLTGAYNRRYFSKMLREKIYRQKRYGELCALLLIDLDNFKVINDSYGHDVGDEVLRELSLLLQKKIRESDLYFRLGGEEFAVLLSPVDGIEAAVRKAEELRRIVEESRFGPGEERLRVTISIGLSLCRAEDEPSTLFKRADEYLYLSKRMGKNLVTSEINASHTSGPVY